MARRVSPGWAAWHPGDQLGKPAAGRCGGPRRQGVGGKEALLANFFVWLRHSPRLPAFDDEQGDMVARKGCEIGVKAEQIRGSTERNTGFLGELTRQRFVHRFSLLHPAP